MASDMKGFPARPASQWIQQINEQGNNLSNWTSFNGGTWTTTNGFIEQTDTTNTGSVARFLRFNTIIPVSMFVAELVIQLVGSPPNVAAGFAITDGATYNGTPAFRLGGSGSTWNALNEGPENIRNDYSITISPSVTNTTWHVLRVISFGTFQSYYIDGISIGSGQMNTVGAATIGSLYYFALSTYGCRAQFRDIRVWTPALPF